MTIEGRLYGHRAGSRRHAWYSFSFLERETVSWEKSSVPFLLSIRADHGAGSVCGIF
jgi:hypothetical protein